MNDKGKSYLDVPLEITVNGKREFLYEYLYQFEGNTRSLELYAENDEDAKAQVDAIKNSLTILGRPFLRVAVEI